MKHLILVFLSLLIIQFPAHAQKAPTTTELLKRIEALEAQQIEDDVRAAERQNVVFSFFKNDIYFGGFFEGSWLTYGGPDTDFASHNQLNVLGINTSATITPRFRFVSQFLVALGYRSLNRNNNPRLNPSERTIGPPTFVSQLPQAYLEYGSSNLFNVQAGMGYVPFGFAAQQRELVLFIRRGGPQILRINDILIPIWQGVHIHGRKSIGNLMSGYNLYTAQTLRPKIPGLGGRLWLASKDEKVVGGVSALRQKTKTDATTTLGADLRFDFESFILTAEFAQQIHEGNDPWTAYLEPAFFLGSESYLLYLFADYASNPYAEGESLLGDMPDPYDKLENGFGLNWLPTPAIRYRAGVAHLDYQGKTAEIDGQDRDAYIFDISVAVAF